MSNARRITNNTFDKDILSAEIPVLVDFYADWCGPCRAIAPMIDDVAEALDGKIDVVKLDIDENAASALKYKVNSIPTLILFKDGEPIERWVGVVSKQAVLDGIEAQVSEVETVDS
jgi:thioredoxin 1